MERERLINFSSQLDSIAAEYHNNKDGKNAKEREKQEGRREHLRLKAKALVKENLDIISILALTNRDHYQDQQFLSTQFFEGDLDELRKLLEEKIR